ncbi:MAG: N-methyl-L-tryptophan oxidase [Gaiellaceae bacterium]
MTERYDVVVVGVGGMGSSALYHLARRGKRALGLERFDMPHELGSSHGITRIIRLAYFEHPAYVPLVRRAYELWRELESRAGEQLLHVTGAVEGGPGIFEGALRSCYEHEIPHEALDGREVGRRFPAYHLPPDLSLLYQPDGGFLLPERCIVAHLKGAVDRGAVVRAGERVVEWGEGGNGVRVRTDRGVVEAEKLVLTAGAYSQDVARLPPGSVTAQRQVLAWFQPLERNLFAPTCFPVFNVALEEGHLYGFPEFGVPGFKVGYYDHDGERGAPDLISRVTTDEDEAVLRPFAERYFPAGAGSTLALKACLFELSPDEHFLIDLHPESELALVGAGFSGHGFKFCSVVGEILADLALDGETRHDIGFLRFARFG